MRKLLVGIGVALLLVMVACQSAESKEVLEYHNAYINNIDDKLDVIDEQLAIMYDENSTEEQDRSAIEKLEPILAEMKEYMEKQDPVNDDTKEYHELRKDFVFKLIESLEVDIEIINGLWDDSLTEEQAVDLYEKSDVTFEEAAELAEKAEDKINELSEKYDFKEIKE